MKEVAAIAILNDHHILMGRRRDSQKFTNPGGHLNPGENPLAGAAREVKEETGLSLDPHNFVHMETRIVKKPSGEKIKVHGYKVHLRTKPSTSMTQDPDNEVHRWQWVKLDGGLDHIKDNLHVPLGDNVLLDNLLKEKPVKRHIGRFWGVSKRLGKGAMDDIYDKATKEGPQQYLQRRDQEKKAAEIVRGGKADWMSDDRFSDKQLRMGVSIEKEHTTNPRLAKEIAKDHLTEDRNYYTHLNEMEDKYMKKKASSGHISDEMRKQLRGALTEKWHAESEKANAYKKAIPRGAAIGSLGGLTLGLGMGVNAALTPNISSLTVLKKLPLFAAAGALAGIPLAVLGRKQSLNFDKEEIPKRVLGLSDDALLYYSRGGSKPDPRSFLFLDEKQRKDLEKKAFWQGFLGG